MAHTYGREISITNQQKVTAAGGGRVEGLPQRILYMVIKYIVLIIGLKCHLHKVLIEIVTYM